VCGIEGVGLICIHVFGCVGFIYVYMYVCMYICVYVCMYICMYVYIYICIYVCMYVCMYVYMYICMFYPNVCFTYGLHVGIYCLLMLFSYSITVF
jgi:hypothetical protein